MLYRIIIIIFTFFPLFWQVQHDLIGRILLGNKPDSASKIMTTDQGRSLSQTRTTLL